MLYDDFSTPQPDPGKWVVGEIRDGDQLIWRYADPNLQVRCADNRCTLEIPTFSLRHDQVPMFDNPKALYVATRSWDVAREPLTFSTTLGARMTGDAQDYRDGFAAFNVLDFASGSVFDIVTTGERIYAIIEQLALPGVETPVAPFTEMIDLGVKTEPLFEHDLRIEFDPVRRMARFWVDNALQLAREVELDPRQLTLAFGIITLHPLADGGSTSVRGQGGLGVWGAFHVEDGTGEMEAAMSPQAG
jgi:hypothetical protein